VIEYNEIYHYTRAGRSGRTGIQMTGVGHTVRHNTIYDANYNAINFYVSLFIS